MKGKYLLRIIHNSHPVTKLIQETIHFSLTAISNSTWNIAHISYYTPNHKSILLDVLMQNHIHIIVKDILHIYCRGNDDGNNVAHMYKVSARLKSYNCFVAASHLYGSKGMMQSTCELCQSSEKRIHIGSHKTATVGTSIIHVEETIAGGG